MAKLLKASQPRKKPRRKFASHVTANAAVEAGAAAVGIVGIAILCPIAAPSLRKRVRHANHVSPGLNVPNVSHAKKRWRSQHNPSPSSKARLLNLAATVVVAVAAVVAGIVRRVNRARVRVRKVWEPQYLRRSRLLKPLPLS